MARAATLSFTTPTSVARAPRAHRQASAAAPSILGRLWDRYRGWKAQRETLRLLYSLDHATLRDLGISPRQIDALVYGAGSDAIRHYDHDWWRK